MSETMKIKKSTLYLFGTILLILIGGYFMMQNNESIDNTNVINEGNAGQVQNVVIGMKNYNYYPNTIKVKAGLPVSLSLDSSVAGCFRDFTIRELGVRKYLVNPSDKVEFTPTKPGRYTFACSMGMGTGTLVVE
ncbi:hypothetical protein COU54_01535 [Candidatus Pacearchaeota archaeon CG10_big_fil_rev_8_21_14_0_10_31_24]|nr:MAG: hypothetical protein COU54_01535 [Candidatus Pacearchaeota archaeon CG10_big_fil_rev_8_21_14_0_10_31_24]